MVAIAAKVRLEVADGVATVSLNRPERHNAIDDELQLAQWNQVHILPSRSLQEGLTEIQEGISLF